MKMIKDYSAYEIVMIVHELHKRGYEQLRLLAGWSPNGLCWRWLVYPKVLMTHGNRFEHDIEGVPFRCLYSSTGEDYPKDREPYSVDEFIKGNEGFLELARGEDKAYVDWYKNIISHAENKDVPIAFGEYFSAKQWKFMSDEDLEYPPFESVSTEGLSDELIIEYAKCAFDDESITELEDVLTYDGLKMNQHEIADVIRQAIKEHKGLVSHLDVYETNRLNLIAWGDK